MKKNVLIYLIFFFLALPLHAQEIDFGAFAEEDIRITNVGSFSTLDFGQVMAGEGLVQIGLTDSEIVVYEIEAEFDKDVFVTVTPPSNEELQEPNSSDTMPITIRWAYANKGKENVNQAEVVSGESERFPVLARGNRPPGPPPTPRDDEKTIPTAKAYLYIYGDIEVGNNLSAGSYGGTITIEVSYD